MTSASCLELSSCPQVGGGFSKSEPKNKEKFISINVVKQKVVIGVFRKTENLYY